MSGALRFVLPYQTVIDSAGVPLSGAYLFFYASGTSTPLNTYSDAALTIPNTNPVQANAAGVFPSIFMQGANYKAVLTDSSLTPIWTADPVSVFNTPVFIGGTSGGSENAQTVATTTPSGFALTQGWTIIFKAGFTNTGATQLNVGSTGLTNVYKATAAGPVALTGGEIFIGQLVSATFDGVEFLITPYPVAGWGLISGAAGIQISTANPPFGFDGCNNLSITASVSTNVLTFNFYGNNGAVPSALNPILCSFRDVTNANGDPVWVTATAALSINTNATGATLGSTNGVPFRVWIVLFNNSGTIVPGLINCWTTTHIFPLAEDGLASTTSIGSAATSAGVFYTPNGTTIASKPFRIVGYFEYSAGLATAGTYDIVPTKVQLFGPGIKKPGDIVQVVENLTGAVATGTTTVPNDDTIPQITEGDQYMSQAITPNSAANILEVEAQAIFSNSTGVYQITSIFQNAIANALQSVVSHEYTSGIPGINTLFTQQLAATTSAITFSLRSGMNSGGTTTFNGAAGSRLMGSVMNSYMRVTERMG